MRGARERLTRCGRAQKRQNRLPDLRWCRRQVGRGLGVGRGHRTGWGLGVGWGLLAAWGLGHRVGGVGLCQMGARSGHWDTLADGGSIRALGHFGRWGARSGYRDTLQRQVEDAGAQGGCREGTEISFKFSSYFILSSIYFQTLILLNS